MPGEFPSSRGSCWSSRSVMVVTLNECGERSGGSPASRSRRFISRHLSLLVIGMLVSRFSLRTVVGKRGRRLVPVCGSVQSGASKTPACSIFDGSGPPGRVSALFLSLTVSAFDVGFWLSLLELCGVDYQLRGVPFMSLQLTSHDRRFTNAMKSGSIEFKRATIRSGSSR